MHKCFRLSVCCVAIHIPTTRKKKGKYRREVMPISFLSLIKICIIIVDGRSMKPIEKKGFAAARLEQGGQYQTLNSLATSPHLMLSL